MRVTVIAAGLVVAIAQGPGDGVSKSTYAAETDPLGGMAFLQRYFGTTPAEDSCPANVCQCKAGDSGAASPWEVLEGRSQLILWEKAGHYPGKCVLRTKSGSVRRTGGSQVAVTPSSTPGDDCTYTSRSEVPAADGDAGYVVNSHTQDLCCKSCAALSTCTGATFIAPNNTESLGGMPGPQWYEGFGLHLPAVTAHKTTGGIPVKQVEAHVGEKMGDMSTFDAWMDFNVGLFTVDMDGYLTKLAADGVPHLRAKWPTSSGDSMYSVFVHVPKSQLILELIATSSQLLEADSKVVTLEQRLSDTRVKAIKASPPTGTLLKVVKVSRAATDLEALDNFYVTGIKAEKVHSVEGAALSARCYLWPNGKADVCFVKRADNATSGTFKVGDYEQMLNKVADTMLGNPNCASSRYEDNHYAVDLRQGNFDHIVTYLANNPSVKFQCGGGPMGGLHYIYDPTGWAIQLDMQFSSQPPGCSSGRRLQPGPGGSNPMCSGGTCSAGPSPSPGPAPGPGPAPSPPPGSHCDQCARLVRTTCRGGNSCTRCAHSHTDDWYSIGCTLPGCSAAVAAACGGGDQEEFVV